MPGAEFDYGEGDERQFITTATSVSVRNLEPGRVYSSYVRALDSAGASPFTEPAFFITRDPEGRSGKRAKEQAALSPEPRPDPATLVHHYTKATGLVGIIGSGRVWATMLQYLNDNQEYLYIYKQAVDYLDRMVDLKQPVEKHPDLALAIQKDLLHGKPEVPLGGQAHRFVVSFSEASDDLSQWRAYGQLGGAYALRFSARGLFDLAQQASDGWRFVKCRYGEGAYHVEVLTALHETFANYDTGETQDPGSAVTALREKLARLAPTVKHEAFAAEREWRLISPPISVLMDLDRVKYREGLATLIPYVHFDLPLAEEGASGSLLGVTVGPGPSPHYGLQSTLGLMATRGIHASVTPSAAPYRTV
jgi:Protein of unknown function (DUF2971)